MEPSQAHPRFRLVWALIQSDLYRYAGSVRFHAFMKHYLFTPGFKYTVVMRLCGYLKQRRWAKWTLYPPLKLLLLRYRYKYGIAIPEYTKVGPRSEEHTSELQSLMRNSYAVFCLNKTI